MNISKKIKQLLKQTTIQTWILIALIILYITFFTFFTFQKHQLFLTGRYDLGNMDQTVWNTLHGNIFQFTNPDFDEVMSRLSVHSDFILILLAPFYLIWSDPRMLLLIQTIVLASGAIFIYLLAKKILPPMQHQPNTHHKTPYNFKNFINLITLQTNSLPLILSLSYLLNPYVQRQNIFDFHPVSLATTFLLGAFYFLETNKTKNFLIFLLLATLTKEHIFLIAALFGIYIFFSKKKTWGILLTITSGIIFYLLVSIFIPQARGATHFAAANFKDLGDTPTQIITSSLSNPLNSLKILQDHNTFTYLKYLFMSIGYLSILSPLYFLFALPEFLLNTLSEYGGYRSFYYHYAAASIPFIYISAIFGIKKLLQKIPSKTTALILCLYILSFSLYAAWYFGPLPGAKRADKAIFETKINTKAIHDYLKTIPPETPVAASNNLAAHLVHRQKIYTPANGTAKAELILILNTNKYDQKQSQQIIQQLKNNPAFKIDYQKDNFVVFKKRKSPKS